jgi:hypothetical protein
LFSQGAKFSTLIIIRKTLHQIRKHAIRAKGVGLVAKIMDDLQQPLLAGSRFQ